MRIQHRLLIPALLALALSGTRGFHTASTWQERPAPLLAVGASSTTAEFPTTTLQGSDNEATSKTQAFTTLTANKEEESAGTSPIKKPHQLLSLARHYRVTLLFLLTLASGAYFTRNLALSAQALRMRRNILAGSMIFTVGDVGAQVLTFSYKTKFRCRRSDDKTASSFALDQQRLHISTILGAVWSGIMVPLVYDGVERLLPGHQGFGRILLKMAISCSFLSTAGNWMTMFFRRFVSQMCNFVMEQWRSRGTATWWPTVRENWMQCVASCNGDFYEVLMDDLKIWPLYDILCYSCIPPFIRPITTAIMSSLWSMYMSIASAAVDTHQEQEKRQLTEHVGDVASEQESSETTTDSFVGAEANTKDTMVD